MRERQLQRRRPTCRQLLYYSTVGARQKAAVSKHINFAFRGPGIDRPADMRPARDKESDDSLGRAVSSRPSRDVTVTPVLTAGRGEATVDVRPEPDRTVVSATTEPSDVRPPGGGDTRSERSLAGARSGRVSGFAGARAPFGYA